METESDEIEKELLATMRRIEFLLTLLAKLQIKPILEAELADNTLRTLYEMTGERTARDIVKATGLSLGTISGTWSRWEQLGLVVKDGKQYRKSLRQL